jgi:hypothetical protein
LEDQGVDGWIRLIWIFRKSDGGGMEWIDLVGDRDRWREIVNTVINL